MDRSVSDVTGILLLDLLQVSSSNLLLLLFSLFTARSTASGFCFDPVPFSDGSWAGFCPDPSVESWHVGFFGFDPSHQSESQLALS